MALRPDGRYLATARLEGKKKPFYSRISQEDADRQAREARQEASRRPQAIPALTEFGTFANFVYTVYCPRTYEDARPTTKAAYDGQIRLHILPILGPLQIAEIGYDEISKLKASLRRRNKKGEELKGELSPARAREVLLRTREILNLYNKLAKAKGGQTREDWSLVKLPIKPSKKKRDEPEDDFTVKLLRHTEGHDMQGPIFCALFLALRRGEICGLRWGAIDRKRLRVVVSEQRHPLLADGSVPKDGESREIPIPIEVLGFLDAYGDKNSPYVFTMEAIKGGRRRVPLMENEVSKAVPELVVAAGLERRTLHDLRSFACDNLSEIGADPYAVMEILGHASLNTTTIYRNARERSKRAAVKALLEEYATQKNQQTAV